MELPTSDGCTLEGSLPSTYQSLCLRVSDCNKALTEAVELSKGSPREAHRLPKPDCRDSSETEIALRGERERQNIEAYILRLT